MKNHSKSSKIRDKFTNYFHNNSHKILESSSIAPENDNTILFTNAGMVQFKKWFTGEIKPKYENVVTVQKCLRAGGKHNDLDNVGFTLRHHTFFEMLGNFSFGDLSLIHISEPTRRTPISYAVFCLKKKK